MTRNTSKQAVRKSVAVIGAGNIGSHFAPHVARMSGVTEVALIDRDVYEQKNLRSQDITASDVGRPKVEVQAERVRRINPTLMVHAIHDAVQNVPPGRLRSDVIVAALDSREARRYVNEVAWRLGVPWIDAGVSPGGGWLVRVNVYMPGLDRVCLECAWSERDYELLEQAYPCPGLAEAKRSAATNGVSSLGALAAALEAIECQKLLDGRGDRAAIGQQVLLDAEFHKYYVTRFRRNPKCRFDHRTWDRVDKLPSHGLTVADALDLAKDAGGRNSGSLRVEGKAFVFKLTCRGCGRARSILRLQGRLRPSERACPTCRGEMVATGWDMREELRSTDLPRRFRNRALKSLGFMTGDVLSVSGRTGETHYELVADSAGM